MFESLKSDISALSSERDNIRTQVHKYIELLEKTYAENEALRTHIDGVMDENSKLKDNILQMQQLLTQSQQSIYTIMLQQKINAPNPQMVPMGAPSMIPQMMQIPSRIPQMMKPPTQQYDLEGKK